MKYRETHLSIGNLVVSIQTEAGISVSGHVDSFVVDAPPEALIRVRSSMETLSVGGSQRFSVTADGIAEAMDVRWRSLEATDGVSVIVHRSGLDLVVQYAPGSSCDLVNIWLTGTEGGDDAAPTWSGRDLSLVELLPLPSVVLLSGRQGLFLHSCAVTDHGESILFAGVSGSGKSTMSELWQEFGPPTTSVIDDEHIIAQRVNGRMRLYGAPWKRGRREASDTSAPLKAIFLLAHGAENRCVRLSPGGALAQLMSQVFLPLWSRDLVELTLQTCDDLVLEAECYRLEFVPDAGVVSFVQDVLEASW